MPVYVGQPAPLLLVAMGGECKMNMPKRIQGREYEMRCARLFGRWVPVSWLMVYAYRGKVYLLMDNFQWRWN
jgi:hypothetical protein